MVCEVEGSMIEEELEVEIVGGVYGGTFDVEDTV